MCVCAFQDLHIFIQSQVWGFLRQLASISHLRKRLHLDDDGANALCENSEIFYCLTSTFSSTSLFHYKEVLCRKEWRTSQFNGFRDPDLEVFMYFRLLTLNSKSSVIDLFRVLINISRYVFIFELTYRVPAGHSTFFSGIWYPSPLKGGYSYYKSNCIYGERWSVFLFFHIKLLLGTAIRLLFAQIMSSIWTFGLLQSFRIICLPNHFGVFKYFGTLRSTL